MWRGIFALLFRSLRTDSRSGRIQLLWFCLLVVIYLSLWSAQQTSLFFGAPGLLFFKYVVYVNAAFISLLGIGFFSSAITEEKEEDTLGLMMMAGISPLGILLGKSTSRLFQVLLLLAIQYPFTLLAVTLGGLSSTQITSAYVSLFSYTILLANVGLLCSVFSRRSRDASGLTVLWLIGYCTVPAFATAGYWYLTMSKGWVTTRFDQNLVLAPLNWLSVSHIVTSLNSSTQTGHTFEWSPQIVGNAAGGLLCFLLSWWLFGFVALEPTQEATSRGMVARRSGRRLNLFSAGRAWDAALVWKDFHFIGGGWAAIVLRCLLYSGLYGLCVAANHPTMWGASSYLSSALNWEDVTWGFLFFSHPLLALDIALCVSRVFHEELRGQTLSSLLMLPRSIPNLAYSKLIGASLVLVPGIFANSFALLFLPGGTKVIGDAFDEPVFWWWILNLVLLIHLTVVLSLHLRWGAMALSFGLTAGSMFLTGIAASALAIAGGFRFEEEFFGVLAVALGLVCIGCHAIVLLKLPKLGER